VHQYLDWTFKVWTKIDSKVCLLWEWTLTDSNHLSFAEAMMQVRPWKFHQVFILMYINSWMGPFQVSPTSMWKSFSSENELKLTQTNVVVPSHQTGKTWMYKRPRPQVPFCECGFVLLRWKRSTKRCLKEKVFFFFFSSSGL